MDKWTRQALVKVARKHPSMRSKIAKILEANSFVTNSPGLKKTQKELSKLQEEQEKILKSPPEPETQSKKATLTAHDVDLKEVKKILDKEYDDGTLSQVVLDFMREIQEKAEYTGNVAENLQKELVLRMKEMTREASKQRALGASRLEVRKFLFVEKKRLRRDITARAEKVRNALRRFIETTKARYAQKHPDFLAALDYLEENIKDFQDSIAISTGVMSVFMVAVLAFFMFAGIPLTILSGATAALFGLATGWFSGHSMGLAEYFRARSEHSVV